jgi:hypothetical protein
MDAQVSRVDVAIRWTTTVSVVLLAGIAAIVSYRHMHTLALEHGEIPWTAALIPLSVDGMIVASSMSLLLDSRRGIRSGALPWLLLLIGSSASLAANVAVAEPTPYGRIIAAWPSLALIGAYELLMRQIRLSTQDVRRGSPVVRTTHRASDSEAAPRPGAPAAGSVSCSRRVNPGAAADGALSFGECSDSTSNTGQLTGGQRRRKPSGESWASAWPGRGSSETKSAQRRASRGRTQQAMVTTSARSGR